MKETLLLIGGEWVRAASASDDVRFFHRLNPVDDQPVTRAAAGGVTDVAAAVKAAAEAIPVWAATGPGKRRDLLLRAADVLAAHQREFIESMIAETGATEGWAAFNVAFGASVTARSCLDDDAGDRRDYSQRRPRQSRHGYWPAPGCVRRHCALERARHSRCPGNRHASGLWKHGHLQGVGGMPRGALLNRDGFPGGWVSRRRFEHPDQ
jgi:hypothetical protein